MSQLVIEKNPAAKARPEMGATAVIYLRVSSPSQLTGYSRDGYSIESQREACERYAASLGARIVREYIEPGRSATNTRRKALQQLLAELGEVKPTYVIFFDLSRVARDEPDAFWLLGQIKSHGFKLTSTREPVDDSPQGLLLFAIMAGVNAFRSRDDGAKVKLGLERKHADGGSMGPARIGYLNDRKLVDGREVAVISVDEDRAGLVQQAFDLFATGEHTITTITDLLEDMGLRTRATPKRPSKRLSRSMVHRMLSDDYYIGVVTLNGVKRRGRHQALIDPEVFEQVQQVLRAHKASGDRSHKHRHYLVGSLHCKVCECRLGYGRHRGNGGIYEYFSCLSRMSRQGRCVAPYFRVETVERRVEQKYRRYLLDAAEQAAIREALLARAETMAETARKEANRHARRLRELTSQQQKLVHLYYDQGVSKEVLKAEQQRIEAEQAQVEHWQAAAASEIQDVDQALSDALALIDAGTAPYLSGNATERRLINLAIYLMLLVSDPDHVQAKPTAFYAQLVPTARQLAREAVQAGNGGQSPGTRPQDSHSPIFRGYGSQNTQMAERAGFEPAMEFDPHTRLAGECLQPLGHLSLRSAGQCRACRAAGAQR
jgi:site-specific DNA recombinase